MARTASHASPRASSRALVVTGMHRSGTSLVASLVRNAGVHMGDQLLGARRGNARGHFEDAEFVAFHEQALFERGRPVLATSGFVFDPTEQELATARQLVAARSAHALWGWKDPRTSLFLDFWDGLIPDATYVLLYRHPLEVVLSLVRRADVNYIGLVEAIESWCTYNEALLAFRARAGRRTILCEAHALLAGVGSFGRVLGDRLGLDLGLSEDGLASVYATSEFRALPRAAEAHEAFSRLHPEAVSLLLELDRSADIASGAPTSPPADVERGRARELRLLPRSIDDSRRRAWLAVLVSGLEPEGFEGLHEENLRHHVERERGLRWLRQQERDQRAEIERWRGEADKLREAVADLERGRDWLEAQRAAHQAEIDRWKGEADKLREAVADLERGRDWLEAQRAAHQAEIDRWRAEYDTLKAWALDRERVVVELADRPEPGGS